MADSLSMNYLGKFEPVSCKYVNKDIQTNKLNLSAEEKTALAIGTLGPLTAAAVSVFGLPAAAAAAASLLAGGCAGGPAEVGQTQSQQPEQQQEQQSEQGVYDPGTKYGILTPDTNEPIGVIDQDEARKVLEDGVRLFNEVIEKYTNDTYTDSGDKIVNQNGQVAGWQSPEDSKFAYGYDENGRKVTEYEITPNYERTKTFNYNASDDHVLKTTVTKPQNEGGSYAVEFEEE